MYADDLQLFCKILCVNDCENLRKNVNIITDWCYMNRLQLNVSKCQIITYTRKQNCIKFNYTINNSQLNRLGFINDLGVIFDPKLAFTKHVETKVCSAFKNIGFIIRNASMFNSHVLRILFVFLVRPHLEYCSIIWNPIYTTHI